MGDLIKQVPEPEGIKAASDHQIVILVVFQIAVVFAFYAHTCVKSMNAPYAANHSAYVFGVAEFLHRLEREDATIGAPHKFAAIALA